ncbi:hypothetical protein RHMOL_Rhmol05G0064400 [Rhododendron molle]|uniref:Uncharacterized protein n=1 Tax=Rhododendron molle TaxID=49168 RepID=A0ACC0NMB0_RHOML|nr:hypothetical protein RHMOL_Rhmol05G0064400 [Rhododendron molle]
MGAEAVAGGGAPWASGVDGKNGDLGLPVLGLHLDLVSDLRHGWLVVAVVGWRGTLMAMVGLIGDGGVETVEAIGDGGYIGLKSLLSLLTGSPEATPGSSAQLSSKPIGSLLWDFY